MGLDRAFAIAAAGLAAQRTRMETVASNLVNVRTTRTAEGGPYRRLSPVFQAERIGAAGQGDFGDALRSVAVERVVADDSEPLRVFEPGHPDADETGYVSYPSIDLGSEMVDMLSATRSYEANVTLVRSVRDMVRTTLEILG